MAIKIVKFQNGMYAVRRGWGCFGYEFLDKKLPIGSRSSWWRSPESKDEAMFTEHDDAVNRLNAYLVEVGKPVDNGKPV